MKVLEGIIILAAMAGMSFSVHAYSTKAYPCGIGILAADCTVNTAAFQAAVAASPSVPIPLGSTPPAATPSGAIGTPGTYIPGNAVAPSLTRTVLATTASDGTFSVSWATALISSSPSIILTPMNTGSQAVLCNATAATSTSVTGKCWTLQNTTLSLAVVTTGINLSPSAAAAAGIKVSVFAREPTQ